MADWSSLSARLHRTTGSEAALDTALADALGLPSRAYTGSVEDARALAAAVLPEWRLHLGWGATGMFPYARLSNNGAHIEAEAPTLPLAILRAVATAASPTP